MESFRYLISTISRFVLTRFLHLKLVKSTLVRLRTVQDNMTYTVQVIDIYKIFVKLRIHH